VEPWKTGITTSDDEHIWVYGHSVTDLMVQATFTDTIFLLHRGRLPSASERRLFDAMLIAVADHGPGSPSAAAARTVATGNRQAPEAAVAAGVLAIGDAHAGAGLACFRVIADGIARADREQLSLADVARAIVADAKAQGARLPGLGHRTHTADPRTAVLFDLSRTQGLSGRGIEFLVALECAVRSAIKPLPINVDGAIAAVLYDLQFTAIMAKFLFMIGRVAGLTAQVGEEYARERPMRIRIPVTYDGPPPREHHDE
jgi:citrate synthase